MPDPGAAFSRIQRKQMTDIALTILGPQRQSDRFDTERDVSRIRSGKSLTHSLSDLRIFNGDPAADAAHQVAFAQHRVAGEIGVNDKSIGADQKYSGT